MRTKEVTSRKSERQAKLKIKFESGGEEIGRKAGKERRIEESRGEEEDRKQEDREKEGHMTEER